MERVRQITCPTCLVLSTCSLPPRALCPMRSRASRAMHLRGLVFHAPRALNVLVPHVPCALVCTLEPRVLALRVFHIS